MLNLRLKPIKDNFKPVDFDKIILWPWRRCKVRILIVSDGGIAFGNNDFGLAELITKALNTSSRPFVDFVITKAHRGVGTGADINNFKFDNSQMPAPAAAKAFNNTNYDQVWLFGVQRSPILSTAELLAITNFMEAGGGVFATGDHEDLGKAMCAEIPRVRSMRKWYWPNAPAGRQVAPDGGSANRLDTTVVGDTAGYQFNDQSDETPQNIIPRFFTVGTSAVAHPLLSKSRGVIRFLPDHAHEGECVVPSNLTEKVLPGDMRDEYPAAIGGGSRVSPQLVAISYSGAGALTDSFKPAVNPRCFGAIVAYDGHLAGKGRVSVDATWHHFLNINLNGEGSTRAGDTGFYVNGNPTPEYEDIKQYFRNIALWISPTYLQRCFRFRYIYFIRYKFPLIWEVRPNPKPKWEEIIEVGQQTRKMIQQTFSDTEVVEAAKTFVDFLGEKEPHVLSKLLNISIANEEKAKTKTPLLSEDTVVDAILGGVMQSIVNSLPEFPQESAQLFTDKSDDKKLEVLVQEGVKLGIDSLVTILDEQVNTTKVLKELLSK
jgi:hypothetical protein